MITVVEKPFLAWAILIDIPEVVPKDAPEDVPEVAPEVAPDVVPEDVPGVVSEVVPAEQIHTGCQHPDIPIHDEGVPQNQPPQISSYDPNSSDDSTPRSWLSGYHSSGYHSSGYHSSGYHSSGYHSSGSHTPDSSLSHLSPAPENLQSRCLPILPESKSAEKIGCDSTSPDDSTPEAIAYNEDFSQNQPPRIPSNDPNSSYNSTSQSSKCDSSEGRTPESSLRHFSPPTEDFSFRYLPFLPGSKSAENLRYVSSSPNSLTPEVLVWYEDFSQDQRSEISECDSISSDNPIPDSPDCNPTSLSEISVRHPILSESQMSENSGLHPSLEIEELEIFEQIQAGMISYSGPPSSELPKPPVPYQSGWKFTAYAHNSPPPTRVTDDCLTSSYEIEQERNTISPRDRCRLHPPIPGSPGDYALELQVQTLLQVGDPHRGQVFTVSLCGISDVDGDFSGALSQRHFVAKVFDPLYFDDDRGYLDPFLCMDEFYTHEVGAYQAMKNLQGHSIPKFYGSYSICLALPDKPNSCREVRMVLMEFIHGDPMSRVPRDRLSQSTRQKIIHTVVDLETRVYEMDIDLMDLATRNIILTGLNKQDPQPQVVLIDFDRAFFRQDEEDDGIVDPSERCLGQYISPLLRWKGNPDVFEEWVDWDWDSWLENEFADTASTITPEIRAAWT